MHPYARSIAKIVILGFGKFHIAFSTKNQQLMSPTVTAWRPFVSHDAPVQKRAKLTNFVAESKFRGLTMHPYPGSIAKNVILGFGKFYTAFNTNN
mgnify:CR=1 FL=1